MIELMLRPAYRGHGSYCRIRWQRRTRSMSSGAWRVVGMVQSAPDAPTLGRRRNMLTRSAR
ncbi:hypothetical protein Misp03_26570 [Microbispora sp. NBRC 16548]|nr:hypothetical protein Misp03_26570 [Microbispora sp. NBRC 16548]